MGQGGAGWRGPSIGGGKAMVGQGKRGGVVTVFGFRSAAHDMMHGVAGRNYFALHLLCTSLLHFAGSGIRLGFGFPNLNNSLPFIDLC